MIDETLFDAEEKMEKAVAVAKDDLASVRTGRATPNMFSRVVVDYYGAMTPLRQLASISASEARLLTVTPYDKGSIRAIEKGILEADLGLTPSNDGNVIRLTIPELTEERRKDLVRIVRKIAEEGRISEQRAPRRDARPA